jgi:hypothetical protein
MGNLPEQQQNAIDTEHLKLLSIFHYIVSGIAALCACIPFIHLALGLFLIIAPGRMAANEPPAFLGWFFVTLASFFILVGWAFAVLVLIAGRFIAQRRRYTFCFVMGCVECLFMPFGTVLGVFTIFVLMRLSVKDMFTPAITDQGGTAGAGNEQTDVTASRIS